MVFPRYQIPVGNSNTVFCKTHITEIGIIVEFRNLTLSSSLSGNSIFTYFLAFYFSTFFLPTI